MNENHILVSGSVYIRAYFGNYVARISLNYRPRWKLTAVFHAITHKLPCSLAAAGIKVVFSWSKGLRIYHLVILFCFLVFGDCECNLINAVMNFKLNNKIRLDYSSQGENVWRCCCADCLVCIVISCV